MCPKIGFAVTASIITAFLVTLFAKKEPEIEILDKFNSQTQQSAGPILRNFPDTNFQTNGPKVQLGAFSNLKGAEAFQTELNAQGIVAHVEKKMDAKGLLYTVVIGPIRESEHLQILAKLRDNNLNYFYIERSKRIQSGLPNKE